MAGSSAIPHFRTRARMILVNFRVHGADVVGSDGLFCRFGL